MGKYLDLLSDSAKSAKSAERHSSSCEDHTSYNHEEDLSRILRLSRICRELSSRCPAHVPLAAWKVAVEDGKRFLAKWGPQAEAFGWTERDLFGLPEPPANPSWRYNRLARKDCLGLIWLLCGRAVSALTEHSAAIANSGGAVTNYYRAGRLPSVTHAPSAGACAGERTAQRSIPH